jgi:hypothetical protein
VPERLVVHTCVVGMQVVLKMRQAPGSFGVIHETVGWRRDHPGASMDPVVPDTELEWFSPRIGSMMLTALMVRVL